MDSKKKVEISHRYTLLQIALVKQRNSDQKDLEGERRTAIHNIESDHKRAVAKLWADFRLAREANDSAEAAEYAAL